jgi:myo-inositol-1(or 4)-monophosphatase
MVFSSDQLKEWLSFTEEVVKLSGTFLAQLRDKVKQVRSDSGRDIKIEADQESERMIITYLQKRSEFSILSEESGMLTADKEKEGLTWIIDPLDGSLNYSRGIPICCVSVGLWQRDKALLGSVYDFNNDELFSGIVGKGAWLNGETIKTSITAEKEKAVLCTGFPISTDFSVKALSASVQHVREYKKVRLLGSAALSLAYVASGRVDAYIERDIMLWDVAGGVAIVKAAGGRTVQIGSNMLNALTIYASNSALPEPNLE